MTDFIHNPKVMTWLNQLPADKRDLAKRLISEIFYQCKWSKPWLKWPYWAIHLIEYS